MIVETIKIGSATIRVHDDCYVGKSNEEIQSIIDDYCRRVTTSLQKQDKTA